MLNGFVKERQARVSLLGLVSCQIDPAAVLQRAVHINIHPLLAESDVDDIVTAV
jgi:hypothetical protein